MQRGRRLAFDFGDVRIGVAVCDPDGILASPLITLKTSDKNLSVTLHNLFEVDPLKLFLAIY